MAYRRKKFIRKFLKFAFFLATIIFFIGAVISAVWASRLSIPDFQSFESRKVVQSTKIYDNRGEILLYDIYQDISRTVVPFEEIPRHVKNATVAIEDSEFYQHSGVNPKSILRAFLVNLGSGFIQQGGSTITQQLAKKALLTSEKSYARKIKEVIIAFKLERVFSKEEILGFYLNEISYGGSNYGIEAASLYFFGKNAKDLNLTEAAYLAALPQAPTYYSPYGSHREELNKRKNLVLKRMLDLGFITEEEFNETQEQKAIFAGRSEKNIKAPHFVMYVKSYLEEKYGKDLVEEGGLKVITTLDWNLQQKAETIVADYAKENVVKFNAYNAGLTAIDPKTGKILAMVGSKDYFGKPEPEGCAPGINCLFEGNFNVTTAPRQPGSAFKPFAYAAAFKKGYAPETVIFDLKTEFNSSCNPDGAPKEGIKEEECYRPENYDNQFRGPISFKNALAQSINVASVKVLYLAGINDSLRTAQDLGITTLIDPGKYGLTLVLGGGETKLLEMTASYGVFANDGVKNPVVAVDRIENGKGEILEKFTGRPKQMLEPNISRMITNILSDNEARAPAFGSQSYLYFQGRDVAAKTGTTNDYRDAWVIGYTPNLAVGAWVGNNNNDSMEKKVAGFIVAPMWHAFLKEALENIPQEKFLKPEPTPKDIKPILKGEWKGGNAYLVDSISKKRATEYTPKELAEEKVLTQIHSILYWVKKDDPAGPAPENPGLDPQFILWEKPIRDWVLSQNIKEETIDDIPQDLDDIHLPAYVPKITITAPRAGAVQSFDEPIAVKISYQSRFPLKRIDFFWGDAYLGSSEQHPFDFSFIPQNFPEKKLQENLRLIAYDSVLNRGKADIFLQFNP